MQYFATVSESAAGSWDESLPVGEFADITIGDWRGYDLVAAR
jgi:hypothetical protein